MFLAHYTSADGLLKILQSEQLWLTNVRYLNDREEFQHALAELEPRSEGGDVPRWQGAGDIMQDASDGRYNDNFDSRLKELFMRSLVRLVTRLRPTFDAVPVFSCSFSLEPDLLSQWRAYCPNGGYSLAFRKDALTQAAKTQGVRFEECTYGSITKVLFDNLFAAFQRYARLEANNFPNWKEFAQHDALFRAVQQKIQSDEFKDILWDELFLHGPTLKHRTFKEEREWRLIDHKQEFDQDVKYRASGPVLVPYVEFSLSRLLSTPFQIFIGPMSNQNLAEASLQKHLEAHGLRSRATIWKSQIPYRRSLG